MAMPNRKRSPRQERAGTLLDHRFTEPIYDERHRRQGTIDHRQQVYQQGGEAKDFVFWNLRLLTMPLSVWNQIRETDVEWIEMIDHQRNECWRVELLTMILHGVPYERGDGPRYGVPISYVTVHDAQGAIRKPEGSMRS